MIALQISFFSRVWNIRAIFTITWSDRHDAYVHRLGWLIASKSVFMAHNCCREEKNPSKIYFCNALVQRSVIRRKICIMMLTDCDAIGQMAPHKCIVVRATCLPCYRTFLANWFCLPKHFTLRNRGNTILSQQ
jgi:hypothetical protein